MSGDWRRKLSRDPQRPPKGSDPPRRTNTVNKRLRQFERKRQKLEMQIFIFTHYQTINFLIL